MTLSVQAVDFVYDDGSQVLNRVSMNFADHGVVGVVGANGCGKSTLFKILLGLYRPCHGEVLWQEKALAYSKKSLIEHRQRVTLVFQEPDQQIFYTDVFDDIAFSLRNLGIDESEITRRVGHALSLVDGQSLVSKPVQYLSYGQKKRVAIAGALVLDSQYLLLDEPTAGLDPVGTRQMKSLIRSFASLGKHVVMSSHDINLIYELCDYVYVMSGGEVVSAGKPESVFLDKTSIENIGLEQPWLVRMHQELGMPLFRNEQEMKDWGISWMPGQKSTA
ncbi:ATP-binding cassette domain-containing protein [Vibrio mangrovi]|uniref:ABC transporter ATP-binding protein n=1 Tax=Vibrio mangrovi TaxID=474394 RepID=A0A1Y6IY50_9VIBR|nr:ATP-binding cassette domain-containing protein [Vibrio mangrovi]MDW6005202.1 ATP-binding cassette domain-containing protein [Vibrio mangrovi]SMS02589.1 Cobalt import ATP-binding protein CbiO [Vibrio mangrovi]